MPLEAGTKLGPYEIVGLLGAGGMGEVYRARDTRLGRTVAVKVLPERHLQNSELRQRMRHEAQTISKLSHPNICTLHDVGHQGGTEFLVFEFVEGQTLREILSAERLLMRRVIPIAVQVAEGLAKAHEMGIIHRDLKPENLMVTPDAVKILDFGLAKLRLEDEREEQSDTTQEGQTQPGTILGTARYMSPEQASGEELDFRSDQFSFGLVLYEMATGKHAFHRKTPTQTLVAIAKDEPTAMNLLNPEVPPPLSWVVERCMAKDPKKRYFSTRDLVRDLVAIRDRLSDLQAVLPEGRPNNLPLAETNMVGRDKDLAKVKQLLQRKEVRLVTVTGPGGIGKSRLALETARSLTDEFPGGVYFVPLGNLSDASLIPATLAQTLGVKEAAGKKTMENLKEHLRTAVGAPLLLLVDNFEHLVEAAPMLAELLAAAPNLKLLVTSRAALHIYHEHEFSLQPLALPDARALPPWEELSQYPAIALFLERAAAVKPDFRMTEENASSVAEICARLDGLPLAIELAAARVKLLTPSAIQTRLARRLQLLTGGARDLPARQQTLRHAIDWSHDLLTEPEQKLFRRLSVFCGGCTLEEVESVCDTKQDLGMDVLDGMASMVDKSLARQVDEADGEPRFTMLETIREYGLEKLKASDEEQQTKQAHAAYCLVLAEEGAAEDASGIQKEWMDRFETEHDNFRAALDWLTETQNVNWGLRLGAALFNFWETREHLTEGRDRLGRLLALKGEGTLSKDRVRILFAAGVLAGAQGEYVAAEALFNESFVTAQQLGDKKSIAISLNAMAVNGRDQNNLARARAQFEECLALWRELGDAPAVARGLSNLASVVDLQGDQAQARFLYQECFEIFGQIQDRTGIAWTLSRQGDLALKQGDFETAQPLYQLALATFRELNDQWGIAGSLEDLGNLASEQKDYPRADPLYRESLRIFQGLGQKRGVARLLEAFASVAAARSDGEAALRLAGAAAALRQSIGALPAPAEQAKLERNLARAREGLSTTASRAAWLEGWVMRVDKAIEELLGSAASSGCN